jgi:hypothetical protein
MLKLYISGYLNPVQSSRRLERKAGRNLEVMWLTGRLAPDHKTIADFRKGNGPAPPSRRYSAPAHAWRPKKKPRREAGRLRFLQSIALRD